MAGSESGDWRARPLRIGLLWHSSNSGNLGVGALTVANLAIVRDVAIASGFDPKFTIIGMRDAGASYLDADSATNFPIDARSLLSPRGYWAAARQQDCIIDIGAGDSFAEIYGIKRFFFLWLTKAMALARGTPLLLAPQTIGPFTRQPYKALGKWAMTHALSVVARDEMSAAAISELAPGAHRVQSIDVAFALPFCPAVRRPDGGPLRIGVNVSGLLFNEAEAGRNRFHLSFDYARLTRRLLGALVERGDLEVHLVTHALHATDPADDDGRVADRLAREFPMVVRVASFPGPSAAKSYISGLDFLFAARMHACIAAYSSGTPVVPLAYSRKFAGLFGTLGYDRLVPTQGFDEDQALQFLIESLDMRNELRARAADGMVKVEGFLDAYRGELRRLFGVAARRSR